jgi:hypothetical protein
MPSRKPSAPAATHLAASMRVVASHLHTHRVTVGSGQPISLAPEPDHRNGEGDALVVLYRILCAVLRRLLQQFPVDLNQHALLLIDINGEEAAR